MSTLDSDLYVDEVSVLRRAAWPQIAALVGIALAALVPLLLAVALAS